MSKEESFIKFKSDHCIRSQSNKDMFYFLGGSKSFLKEDTGSLRNLFDNTLDYFHDKLKIKEGNKYIEPVKVSYHEIFGWTIDGKTSKSYLGKCSVNGNVEVQIGNSSYVSGACEINGSENLKIGSFTSIANGVEFFTSNINHPLSFATTFNLHSNSRLVENKNNIFLPNFCKEIEHLKENKSIYIGNDVWVGRDVMIMPGVSIPNGCVIGSKSIVTKSLQPYGIYVGTPAKLIKFRFDKKIINQLLEIDWWDWSFEKIKQNKAFFDTNFNDFKGNLKDLIKLK
ncbi:CatB-related O-acetyltransferase [Tenacibaculum ovolyticum]|uniref:CatB-related O-acetyltransferase n=1 Tax=Tenacibaculum ovolyticum TaxID=104270 RepID=UPI001F20D039|nr:CatB-related O-acetyltransferase [Tenacibaculum ovolyticum]